MTDPAAPVEDLDALFTELDKIKYQVSLVRLERPRTDAFLEERKKRGLLQQKVFRALTTRLSNDPQAMVAMRDSRTQTQRVWKIKALLETTLKEILEALHASFTEKEKEQVLQDVIDDLIGLGPIEQLMKDRSITEVMINGPDFVFVERSGRIELTPLRFVDVDHLMKTIDKILMPLGRRVDQVAPFADARLPDGSRVNVVIPPVALNGPLVTIRKFSESVWSILDLVDNGMMSEPMADFLRIAVEGKLNILVSGGTGSGKTTLLNVLGSLIPEAERIATIEDAAEIQIHRTHINVARLESRPANIEGKGAIAIRDLLRNALRMRPDRIIIGEVRGGEAFEMLQAMNTGHDGALSTGHANSPGEMVHRLESMCLIAGLDLSAHMIRMMIADSLNVIVHVSRMKDGHRRITEIAEVAGLDGDRIRIVPIWQFKPKGMEKDRLFGEFAWSGHTPFGLKKIINAGVSVPENLFRT